MPTNRLIPSFVLRKFASLCDCRDSHYTDCFIVSTYLRQNNIHVRNNHLVLEHVIEDENVNKFIDYLRKKGICLGIEDLTAFFEFVVSPQEKEVNGAVYTPEYIRKHIVKYVLTCIYGDLGEKKFADIACGCGGFLMTLTGYLHRSGISYEKIFKDCLYGVDIADYSISRTRLMLTLFALQEEDVEDYQFNLIKANSLSFDWNTVDAVREHGGFDVIVGNPPYVGASKMDGDSRELVKQWEVASSGKADMYIPFFQIAIENLKEDGILGYITVNNFYRSVNGRALRHYFKRRRLGLRIVDFGSEQVFKGRSTYTCLCFVKNCSDGDVYYTTCDSSAVESIQEDSFERFGYQELEDNTAWTLSSKKNLDFIKKVRETGIPLDKFVAVRNGFATLRNDVYLFKPVREDELYYYFDGEAGEEHVEREICRDAIKGNILRCEADVEYFREKLIFPYRMGEGDVVIPIEEKEMQTRYPCTYHYLEKNIGILGQRSKAEKIRPWYVYGRSQALNYTGNKLLFPYIADKPYFILSNDRDLMFYNGYCIVDESLEKLQFLQRLLCSRLFWRYIQATSKPYGGQFYALAKNYIKTFGVIDLSDEQRGEFMSVADEEIDHYIEELYGDNM